ncbi:MAG: malonyl-ACP O-methyltransferase BioC [Candidatus Wenzhouxiangella sp. M2_3B_020]
MFDAATIRRRFGRAADGYAEHARLQAEVAGRLLERLEGLRFEPKAILDLGSGPGLQARVLSERYPAARVVAMDWSQPMLQRAGRRRGWWRKRFDRVVGDANALPLARSSVDLLYSNLMLQWCEDLPALLNAFRRVLKPGGLMLVTTFGPDTLTELRQSWKRIGETPRVSAFADVQTIGDAMLRAGFSEPVLDTDWITTTYRRPRDLLTELKSIGATFAGSGRARGLTPPSTIRSLLEAYESFRLGSGLYPATWEVIYASAWGPEEGAPIRTFHGEEAAISVDSIGKRKR